uniref:DprA-like DNA processing chain A n=1 Tax=Burkholderia phage vB_BgluM-SURPRISE13 TaxID=3159457 RepID=A0AAU7PFA7_9VIRU
MSDGKPIRPIRRDELRKFKNVAVVFGSRKNIDRETFEACLTGWIKDWSMTPENTVFVSGMAFDGPDKFIVDWCKANGWRWHECPADWDNIDVPGARIKKNAQGKDYNALAGFMRNQEMANVSSHGLGFWDGHSPGTKDMMERCNDKQIKLRMIRIPDQPNGT